MWPEHTFYFSNIISIDTHDDVRINKYIVLLNAKQT